MLIPVETKKALEKHANDKAVGSAFVWKDQRNQFHVPCHMATRHLFFTLRMIWNHSVPYGLQLRPFKMYTFSSYYTRDYILQAIKCLSAELLTRDDIDPSWWSDLGVIKKHIDSLNYKQLKGD